MTRRILAIESATDWLSVALLEDETLLASHASAARMQHAAALLPAIDSVLADERMALSDLDAIAVSTGPGSFTSLRIGIATIKGLAFRRSMPTLGISTLEAMALAGLESAAPNSSGAPNPSSGESSFDSVLALLDARRGEWYAASWGPAVNADGLPAAQLTEGLYSPEAIVSQLKGRVSIRAPDEGSWEAVLTGSNTGFEVAEIVRDEAAQPAALWVGRLASRRFAAGEGEPASALSARYVRRAEAEAKRLGGPVETGEVAEVDPPQNGR